MGAMQVLPVLGDHLNVYLPIILVVQCGLIWARAWDRLLCCGGKYKFTDDDTEDAYTERGARPPAGVRALETDDSIGLAYHACGIS